MAAMPDLSDGACQGMGLELFYSEEHRKVAKAKKICSSCPLKPVCLDWSLKHEYYGTWAGLSWQERREIRKETGIRFRKPESGPERVSVLALQRIDDQMTAEVQYLSA